MNFSMASLSRAKATLSPDGNWHAIAKAISNTNADPRSANSFWLTTDLPAHQKGNRRAKERSKAARLLIERPIQKGMVGLTVYDPTGITYGTARRMPNLFQNSFGRRFFFILPSPMLFSDVRCAHFLALQVRLLMALS
jgi:hypothetical protein